MNIFISIIMFCFLLTACSSPAEEHKSKEDNMRQMLMEMNSEKVNRTSDEKK
jgi:starvation-inducible outer membrane lipoprotein